MKKGFTLVEIITVTAVILVLLSVVYASVDAISSKAKTRDVKRLSDIAALDRAVNEYLSDNKAYPDLSDTLRISTNIASNGSSLESSLSGWIDQNLSSYISKLPTDPLNDAIYHYSYIYSSSGYEINVVLESMPDQMLNDGGNDPNSYEIGNNLLLISP